ncbi:MAG: 2Fe-2S iron-sulfur cluster binding domain-containing protein [Burkholderiales bacterium]|nr:2Fe-2S iron-sulfur cluster binding domain-containing protein [Burkholderiales bacterium]
MSHDVRIAGTDVHFPCATGQSLLDAALRAGISMPYSCRKGVCGNCAGAVRAGEVQCAPPGREADTGLYLFCQCIPLGDVEIDPASWHRIDPSARKVHRVKVFRNLQAAPDVNLLFLRLPAGQRARFRAGQYLQVLLADGSRRSYSMANAPHESDMLQLHIRHVPGGRFTQQVASLKPGDLLEVELPFGEIEPQEASDAPLLCVAGGTGFAPVKSLLDDFVKKGVRRPVTLVWGGRDKAGLYLPEAVEKWRKFLPGFRFIASVEDEADARELGAWQGRVDAAVRACCPDLSGYDAYCCGAPAMVTAVRQACVAAGLDPKRFGCDVFVAGPALG